MTLWVAQGVVRTTNIKIDMLYVRSKLTSAQVICWVQIDLPPTNLEEYEQEGFHQPSLPFLEVFLFVKHHLYDFLKIHEKSLCEFRICTI